MSTASAFDSLLKKLGQFGRFQWIHYTILIAIGASGGLQILMFVFTAATPRFWCVSPSPKHNISHQDYAISTPATAPSSVWGSMNGSCTTVRSNGNVTWEEECTEWGYDYDVYGRTIVTEWDLVCSDALLSNLASSLYMVGYMSGCMIFGHVSDRMGRKPAWMMSLVMFIVLGTVAAFMPEYWSHVICRLAAGITNAGAKTIGFVLFMEVTGPDKRVLPGVLTQIGPAMGYMVLSGLAYLIKDYVWLTVIGTLSSLVLVPMYWAMSESPRWLITHGLYDKAATEIHRMARINKVSLHADDLTLLREQVDEEHMSRPKPQRKYYSFLDLVKTPNMRRRSLNISFTWFAISFSYYGLSMGTSQLAGNPYLNLFFSGLVEFPGLAFACLTINRLGRRIPLSLLLVGGGLACLVVGAIPTNWHVTITVLAMIGKLGASGAFGVVYVYSAELFPTVVRTIGVGHCSMCARMGGLVAPLVTFLGSRVWAPLPQIILGSSSVLAGGLCLLLPETLHQDLPETLDTVEQHTTDHDHHTSPKEVPNSQKAYMQHKPETVTFEHSVVNDMNGIIDVSCENETKQDLLEVKKDEVNEDADHLTNGAIVREIV